MHTFIYFHIFILLLRSQENSNPSNPKLQFQFISFHFYCISNHKNHNFTPIIFFNITKFKL